MALYRQNRPAELDLELMRKYGASIPRPSSSVYSNEDELEVTPTFVDGLLRNSSSASEGLSRNINSSMFPQPPQHQQQGQEHGHQLQQRSRAAYNHHVVVNASVNGGTPVPERVSSSNETDVSSVKELSWYNKSGTSIASSAGAPVNRPKPVYKDLERKIEALLLLDPEMNMHANAYYDNWNETAETGLGPANFSTPDRYDQSDQVAGVVGAPFHNLPGSVRVVHVPHVPAENSQASQVPETLQEPKSEYLDKFENLNLDLLSENEEEEDEDEDEEVALPVQKNSNTKIQALLGIGIDYPVQVKSQKKSASKSSPRDAIKIKTPTANTIEDHHRPWPSLSVRGKNIKPSVAPPRPPRSPPLVASKPIMVPSSQPLSFRGPIDSYPPSIEVKQQQQHQHQHVQVQSAVHYFYPAISNSGQPSPAMSSDTGSTIPDTNFLSPSTPTTPSTSPGARISHLGEESIHDDFIDCYYISGHSREGDIESMDSEYYVDDIDGNSIHYSQPLPYRQASEHVTEFLNKKAGSGLVNIEKEVAGQPVHIFDINEDELVMPERDHFKPIKITTPWFAFPDEYTHLVAMDSIRHKELDRLARLPETTRMIAKAQQPASTLANPLPPIALPPLHAPLTQAPLNTDEPALPESPCKVSDDVQLSSRWSDYSSDEDEKPASRWRRSMKTHNRTASSSSGSGVKVDFNLKKNVTKALKMKRRGQVPSSATFGSNNSPSNKRSSIVPPTPYIDLRDLRVSGDSDNESQTTRAPDSWGPTTHLAPTPPPLRFLPEARIRPPTSVPTSEATKPSGSMPKTSSNGKADEKNSKKPLKASKSFGAVLESGRSTPTTSLRSSKSTFDGWGMAGSRNSGKSGQVKGPKVQYGMWI